MGDCLQIGKPSRSITYTKVNSAFHPSRVGKLSTGLSGWDSELTVLFAISITVTISLQITESPKMSANLADQSLGTIKLPDISLMIPSTSNQFN